MLAVYGYADVVLFTNFQTSEADLPQIFVISCSSGRFRLRLALRKFRLPRFWIPLFNFKQPVEPGVLQDFLQENSGMGAAVCVYCTPIGVFCKIKAETMVRSLQ
jgi:hypothetical protein